MATTTNYNWSTPDDTSLVKDGAAAIRTLGSSIDTTTKALNPSTTLGDIEYRSSTSNTNTRLGIGSTGQVLTVAGGVPSWASPATGSTYVGASVTKTAAQSTTSGATTLLTWDAETFDTNGFHDNVTNNSRLTIPTGFGGKYLIASNLYPATGAGFREIGLYKNNSLIQSFYAVVDTNYSSIVLSTVVSVVAGDYLELKFYQNSGGNLNINSGATDSFFSVSYLGA
jgi:hypothetical protein